MVKLRNKLILALSAVAVGATLAGAGIFGLNSAAAFADNNGDEEKATYAVSSVFNATNAAYVTGGKNSGTSYAGMVLGNGGTIEYNKDLAYKWMTEKGETEYFSLQLAFGEIHFTTFSLTFKSAEHSSTSSGNAVNVIQFINRSGNVKVKINDGKETYIDVTSTVKISLAAPSDSLSGKYDVTVNDVTVGQFENIAGSYANAATAVPLTFFANTDGANQALYILEMNGQTFDLDAAGYITDNASPVLVVNQKVKSFALGSAFTLDYSVVDVLASYPTNTVQYYQYSKGAKASYDTLSSSMSFAKTSVYDEYGCEYVSVKFILTDKDTTRSNEVMLSWYVDSSYLTTIDETDYISVGVDSEGPEYGCVTTDDEKKTSVLDDGDKAYLDYIDAVEEASENLGVGSGKYFYLPSLEDLISDGQSDYSELKFNVYYKKDGASSAMSSTALSSDKLSIELLTSGKYVFRVTASDSSGNPMKVYSGGKLISVTGDNVWDFDCIPEFSFSTYSIAASSEEVGHVGTEYAFTDFDMADDLASYNASYSLWYFSGAYGSVSYAELINIANTKNGFEGYIGAESGMRLNRITAYNSSIDKTNDPNGWAASDNDYAWDESTKTFTPQKLGYYVLRVVLTDNQSGGGTIIAYKVIYVEPAAVVDPEPAVENSDSIMDKLVSVLLIVVVIAAVVVLVVLYTRKPKQSASDVGNENKDSDGENKNNS